jgi:regulator of replication initiation timing
MTEVSATSDVSTLDMVNVADVRAVVNAISDMQAQMKFLLEQNAEVLAQNKQLMNKVDALETSEKNKIGERDKLLMESIEESRKVRELLMEQKKKKAWHFWK